MVASEEVKEMMKQFCDRCERDITSLQSDRLVGVEDVDEGGNGNMDVIVDLCKDCYQDWLRWLGKLKPRVEQDR